nr:hypothetical protein [uncultured Desulfobulbus sp.]
MRSGLAGIAALSMVLFMLVGCVGTNTKGSSTNAEQNTAAEPADGIQHVKGINGWEGDIIGTPARGSSFNKLKIGMSLKQVTDLIGEPSDQGAYITGKSFIPFYFGSDMHRTELVYEHKGRLIFAGGSAFGDYAAYNLITITHNPHEGKYLQ